MAHCSVSESTTLSVLPCYLAPLFTTKEHDTWNPKLRHRRVLMNCAHQTYGCIDDAPGISHSYKQLAKAGGNITLHFIHIARHHATHTNQKARKMIYYSHYWVEQSQANPNGLRHQGKETGLSFCCGEEIGPDWEFLHAAWGLCGLNLPLASKKRVSISYSPLTGQRRKRQDKLKSWQQSNSKIWR